jgi:transcriptional regulator with XRE-family HTH domain
MASYTSVTAPLDGTPAALSEISAPHEIVRHLRDELGFTLREIARALGSDERTVRRWAADPGSRPQVRHARRLDDLRHLVVLLQDTLPGEQAARWLRARNRRLAGERPLDLLAADQYDRVLAAAEAYVDGDPA